MEYNSDVKFLDFIRKQLPYNLIDEVTAWIADSLSPEDVFTDEQLKAWARKNAPEDVLEETDLVNWAYENGFHKNNECNDTED